MSNITTIEFIVTYKTDKNTPQHTMPFRNESAAMRFAFQVEVEGGISMITRRVKEEPLTGRPPLSFDPNEF